MDSNTRYVLSLALSVSAGLVYGTYENVRRGETKERATTNRCPFWNHWSKSWNKQLRRQVTVSVERFVELSRFRFVSSEQGVFRIWRFYSRRDACESVRICCVETNRIERNYSSECNYSSNRNVRYNHIFR